jgi:hypothetical protein
MASCKALLTAEENGISCGGGPEYFHARRTDSAGDLLPMVLTVSGLVEVVGRSCSGRRSKRKVKIT